MTPTLWHIELSHYNEKARWALDLKGISHVRKTPQPGLHGVNGRRRFINASAPVAQRLVRCDYGIDAETERQARADILAAMDRVEAELQPSGYLVGDAFSVADLTAAALFTPLLAPPQRPYPARCTSSTVLAFRDELDARPGGRWVAEMYARHRPDSAEVAA